MYARRLEVGRILFVLLWIQSFVVNVLASKNRGQSLRRSTEAIDDKTWIEQNVVVQRNSTNPTKPNNFVQISTNEANRIQGAFNQGRGNTAIPAAKMPYVTWNWAATRVFQNFMAEGLAFDPLFPNWLFQRFNANVKNTITSCPYNICHLMHMGIPSLESLAREGWDYGFRDTGQNSDYAVSNIVHWRIIGQAACCNYNSANTTSFNNFASCCQNGHIVLHGQSKNCNWAYQYKPRSDMDAVTEIAGFRLGIPGPNAPHHQPNSFALFFLYKFANGKGPINDQPFVVGPRGSQCQTTYNSKNHLCMP